MNWRWRKTLRKKDFSLNQLVSIYIKELAGVIYSRKHKQHLPIYEVYEDVMNSLHRKDFEGNDVMKPVREKLLGKDWFKSAPQEYWDILMVMELHYDLEEWKTKPLPVRAKIIAARYLKNMIEIITSYYEDMEDRLKKLGEKNSG